jgi:hypothetical protein
MSDAANSDYAIKVGVTKKIDEKVFPHRMRDFFDFTILDAEGKTVRSVSTTYLSNATTGICKLLNTLVVVEVVDTQNLTQSIEIRGAKPTTGGLGGVAESIENGLAGRRTHTDNATLTVIINGEHALLDCYEHRTGCIAIAPGKYYGELDGESVWINSQMPLTHQEIRNHYVVAGSW